jgi:hypothetical protein
MRTAGFLALVNAAYRGLAVSSEHDSSLVMGLEEDRGWPAVNKSVTLA